MVSFVDTTSSNELNNLKFSMKVTFKTYNNDEIG